MENEVIWSGAVFVDIKSDEEPGIEAVAIYEASNAGVTIAELEVDEQATIGAVFAFLRVMAELKLDACVALAGAGWKTTSESKKHCQRM